MLTEHDLRDVEAHRNRLPRPIPVLYSALCLLSDSSCLVGGRPFVQRLFQMRSAGQGALGWDHGHHCSDSPNTPSLERR